MTKWIPYSGFIFDEDGMQIKIINGRGDDGCWYEQENDLFICRIVEDGDNKGEITGEFDPH